VSALSAAFVASVVRQRQAERLHQLGARSMLELLAEFAVEHGPTAQAEIDAESYPIIWRHWFGLASPVAPTVGVREVDPFADPRERRAASG
jgi:hypothetical protein